MSERSIFPGIAFSSSSFQTEQLKIYWDLLDLSIDQWNLFFFSKHFKSFIYIHVWFSVRGTTVFVSMSIQMIKDLLFDLSVTGLFKFFDNFKEFSNSELIRLHFSFNETIISVNTFLSYRKNGSNHDAWFNCDAKRFNSFTSEVSLLYAYL